MSDIISNRTEVENSSPEDERAGTLSRRTVLSQLAVLVGVGTVGLGGCRPADHEPLIAALVELSPDREATLAIGRAFLDESPMERDRLAARLALELDWRPNLDRATLTTRLLERIKHDFRDGRTLSVDSWLLSQTEVWWAALVALS